MEVQLTAGILCAHGTERLPALRQDGITSLGCRRMEEGDGVCVGAEQKGPQSTGAQREASLGLNWWKGARS